MDMLYNKKISQKEDLILVDYSILHSLQQPDNLACEFIAGTGRQQITYKELDIRARAIAAYLQQHNAQGERAILFLPPGLEYVFSFLGCLYANVVAVPTYVMRNKRRKKNLQAIIEDSNAKFIITSQKLADDDLFSGKKILLLEQVDDKLAEKWQRKPIRSDRLAFLQYTSGSTGKPKGVMVTHDNIIANVKALDRVFENITNRKLCSWLPPYHDMGLIGGILFPLYSGFTTILMPPASFLQDPLHWLKIISEEKVTHSPSPNFAYNLCVEAIKNNNELIKLDLRSWKVAFNGAEPVSARTLENFTKAFSGYCLSSLSICPCYGMAETTLIITGSRPKESVVINKLDKAALEQGKIVEANTGNDRKSVQLVGCGHTIPGHEVIIVDPITKKQLSSNMIGEIWVWGPSIASGYWNKPKLTQANFCARLEEGSNRKYFRTGDLGFLDETNQIFITGRIKDLIIIQGRNIYPQDIEESVCISHREFIPHSSAAFGVNIRDTEHLVIVQEIDRHTKNYNEVFENILKQVLEDHEIMLYRVVLIKQATLPKTSSGKIQRSYCRKLLEEGGLAVIAEWNRLDSGHEAYIPPRNELETKLRDIFASVLGLEENKVGINDDFFKLRGDSIVSIQLVSRIRQHLNINYITIKDIFSYKTIAKLYDNIIKPKLDKTEKVNILSEQGILTGDVPLLPIQDWFFKSNFESPHHWNQAFVIKTHELDVKILQKCIRALVDYHDAFRLRFSKKDIEYYDDKAKVEKLHTIDVSKVSSEKELCSILTDLQSKFNLRYGPIYSIAYIHGFKDNSARVFFALHHLIVDAVSWRILAHNLQHLYDQAISGEKLSLGDKLTSYRQWANIINNYYSNNDKKDKEKSYWNNSIKAITDSNVLLNKLAYSRYNNSVFSISDKFTNSLLKQSNNAYHTEINDLLLSALALALNETLEIDTNYITLEGHGREADSAKADIDISNTLGWFTSMYPVKLSSEEDIATTIKYIKETLRNIPNKGIGYGALIGYATLPLISFNYLGRLDQLGKDDYWSIINEDTGIAVSSKNKDKNIININGAITSGKLSFSIVSKLGSKLHNKLVTSFKQKLEEVITYTASLKRSYLTISDINNVVTGGYLDKVQEFNEVNSVFLANSLQQGFIYHYLNQGDIDDAYLVQMIWTYNNKLNINLLKKAWKSAQIKYPTLRLKLLWDNELIQVIDKKGSLDWRFIDLSKTKNIKDQTKEIRRIQQNDRKEPYTLNKGSLFRVYLIKQRDNLYTCLFSNHHGVLDGWSMPILLQYIHSTYLALLNNKPIDITLDQAYLDAQAYIQKTQDSNDTYWQSQLSKVEEYINLNHLISNKEITNTLSEYRHIKQHKTKTLYIKDKLYDDLKTLSKQEGITLNAILQFVWHKVLSIYGTSNSGSSTTIVGTTISGRDLPINNIESSVGLYINTLPLIIEHDNNDTILDAIRKLQNSITEMNSRSNTNLAKLQKDGDRLFDTLFVYENYPTPVNNNDDNSLNITFKEGIEKLDYPIAVIAYDADNQLTFSLKYAGELFESNTMERLLNTLATLLTGVSNVLNHPSLTLNKLTYLNKQEQELILKKWNDTDKDYPSNKTIHSLFEEQVLNSPNNVAVVYEDTKLTYKELNEKANQLAHYLIKHHSIKPDDLVTLLLDRSENMIIAILGILKAGAAYVPMDPEYPDDRIKYILSDTNTNLVIANSIYTKRLNSINNKVKRIAIDSKVFIKDLTKHSNTNPKVKDLTSKNLAYVIYTSGTTGKPKGVIIEHEGVVNLNCALSKRYNLEKNEIILQLSNYIFDASVEQKSLP